MLIISNFRYASRIPPLEKQRASVQTKIGQNEEEEKEKSPTQPVPKPVPNHTRKLFT